MSATDKSTPRPWTAQIGSSLPNDAQYDDPERAEFYREAVIWGPPSATEGDRMVAIAYGPNAEGTAALIVRCVNRSDAVDALVEAARLVLMDPWEAPTFLNLVALRAALAAYDKEPDA